MSKITLFCTQLNKYIKDKLEPFNNSINSSYEKLNTYASQAVDPQIKQMFTKSAQDALNTKQKLMSFLNS